MVPAVRWSPSVAAVATLMVGTACRDSTNPRPNALITPYWAGQGNLYVETNTTGEGLDPDGYTVTVDGTVSLSIATNGNVTFIELSAGDHSVELSGVAPNCAVIGDNPRIVTVLSEDVVGTTFEVSCTGGVGGGGGGGGGVVSITGLGRIGSGSPTPGSDLQTFDFAVSADLTGRFTYSDYGLATDATVPTLRVDPADPETGITAFTPSSSVCGDPSLGAEFDATGRNSMTGGLLGFHVVACDNGPAESGLDFFSVLVPVDGYTRSGNLTGGDIAKSSP
jgi:hypothetical protein